MSNIFVGKCLVTNRNVLYFNLKLNTLEFNFVFFLDIRYYK